MGYQAGTQRRVSVQTEDTNRRRRRRHSKKKKQAKLPEKERVFHILITSKIKDYTHPSETDKYWDTIYKQYELLCYYDFYLRASLAHTPRPLSDEEIIDSITTLNLIEKYKKLLLKYLMNAMPVMYGSVMNKKFYGWFEHIDEFVARFNETALSMIERLKFDVSRTRCSVYFYQAFWLTGISLKNEITENLCKYESVDLPGDCRDDTFSTTDSTEDFDNLLTLEPIEAVEEPDPEDEIPDFESERVAELGLTDTPEWDDEEFQFNTSDGDLSTVVEYILHQAGLTREALYNIGSNVNELASYLKKMISSGRIKLLPQHKELLRRAGFRVK